MNHATRMTSNQPSPSPCATTSKTKMRTRTQEEMASRPSFASRMIRLIFKRKQRYAVQRAKSWPGCAEPFPVPVSTAVRSRPSTTIAIPNTLASSAPSKVPTAHQQGRKHATHDSSSEASWRQRQTRCTNCEQLFFKSMSTLTNTAGRFCSLDCKANFEYLTQLQETMSVEMMGNNVASSG
ncbi:hypothetical protein PC129_g8277 [Phytophthora cactorum]|uniref:FLZ-type domain-containing protein n=3 Tax=Phytophthora cactorum TaxID=29920 RepID=A0A329RQD8_9STRA|nr:hypothetical protein Pcac1_g15651 [Phytophthora cactorum]KAG3000486.1 hypothetical protein PC119_g16969 [Phytophthora cactorum]KAG3149093.1 hypothetical protein C6341_g17141 [Phytophthora cactorum]KAG3220957.1 hypothetical protein PC129_g8277 [Phytophthora cactorum]KAG4048162.1 hypothetical protein PC123_g16511 [Phytophthora cactorum]